MIKCQSIRFILHHDTESINASNKVACKKLKEDFYDTNMIQNELNLLYFMTLSYMNVEGTLVLQNNPIETLTN